MSRKVVSLSLSPELLEQFSQLARSRKKSQSELFREFIVERSSKSTATESKRDVSSVILDLIEGDAEHVTVVGLVIVRKAGKMLIVSRRTPDPTVENLGWALPGSRVMTFDLRGELKSRLKEKLGQELDIGELISARVMPETYGQQQKVVALYFESEWKNGKVKLNPENYSDYKWVKPLDAFTYFTSSTSDDVTRYISSLHREK